MLLYGIVLLSLMTAVLVGAATGSFAGLAWLAVLPLTFAGSFIVLLMLAFGFLWFVCHIVDTSRPQEHDSKFYRCVTNLYIETIMKLARVHVQASGLEKTPKEGRFLLVCNHNNDSDPALLLHFFKDSQLAFISKQENSTMFIVGKVMHKIMCQLLNRENDRQALKTIIKCIQLIKDDEVSVGVFPEGGINGDHLLHPFRPGVFKIAQKAGVPIVVCTLKGTQDVFRNLKKWKRTDVRLHLVGVIPAEDLKGRNTVDISDQAYRMMAEDLGEDLVCHEQNT